MERIDEKSSLVFISACYTTPPMLRTKKNMQLVLPNH